MSLAAPEPRVIPIGLIDAPALPARTRMDDQKLDELVASMKTDGFTSVIAVVRVGERYEVVYGHRRRIAAECAGIVAIPCLVYPEKTAALERLKYGENAWREDMRPSEEAIYFAELLERECGGDTDRLAALMNRTRAYVEGRLLLLQGDADVFAALDEGAIGVGHAEQLNRCGNAEHRRYLLHQAVTCGLTVGALASAVSEWKHLHSHVAPPASDAPPAAVDDPAPLPSFFTCVCCELTENPGNMRPFQIHTYCERAILRPALAFFQRRSDYVRAPRTHAEAVELLNDLIDRFPSLLDPQPLAGSTGAES